MLTAACRDIINKRDYMKLFQSVHLENLDDRSEYERERMKLHVRRLVQYPVPTQSNPKDGPAKYDQFETYVIDWTIDVYEGAATQSFRPSKSPHAIKQAQNTIRFEEWARTNNRG